MSVCTCMTYSQNQAPKGPTGQAHFRCNSGYFWTRENVLISECPA